MNNILKYNSNKKLILKIRFEPPTIKNKNGTLLKESKKNFKSTKSILKDQQLTEKWVQRVKWYIYKEILQIEP